MNIQNKVFPVIFGFFIMGVVDLIGTAINYVKADFALNDSMANILSLSCFFCFFVLSIPTGLLMNRIGRKNTVLISFIFTMVGLILPLLANTFSLFIIAFTFIGIGNTMIQVSLNPLVCNVVSKEKLTVSLTMGQLLKVISSWLGPNVAAWFTVYTFGWKYVFLVYALATLVAALWLWTTHIPEKTSDENKVSFTSTFSLLKEKKILLFFIGILVLVGVDVGLSTTLPKYLMEKCPNISEVSQADQLKSYYYFIVRAVGAFIGSIVLMKVSEFKFYTISALLSMFGLITILFSDSLWSILASTVIIALGYSNLFAIIFSLALKHLPQKANEVSALLIVGVSGGVFAFLLGIVSDITHSQWGAMVILALLWLYIVWLVKPIREKSQATEV